MGSFGQKITRVFATAIFGVVILSTNVMAIPLPTVGSVDDYLGFCSGLPSGDAVEIACIEGFSGPGTVTAVQKFTFEPSDDELLLELQAVDGLANTWAFELPEEWRGEYFIVKTGNLTPGPNQTIYSYVFRNLSSLAYAVFNINDPDFPISLDGNLGKVSHLTAVQLIATPLPAAVWMFGAALGGLFGFKRINSRRRT